MGNIIIAGAGRQLGLQLVRSYAEARQHVIAISRMPSPELEQLAQELHCIDIEHADLCDPASIEQVKQRLGDIPIDTVINSAAIGSTAATHELGTPEVDRMREIFDIDVLAPTRLIEAFFDNLHRGHRRLAVMISSSLGGSSVDASGSLLYRASKSALNSVARTLLYDLRYRQITVIALQPGPPTGPRTDATDTSDAAIAARIKALLDRPDISALSGRLIGPDGVDIPY